MIIVRSVDVWAPIRIIFWCQCPGCWRACAVHWLTAGLTAVWCGGWPRHRWSGSHRLLLKTLSFSFSCRSLPSWTLVWEVESFPYLFHRCQRRYLPSLEGVLATPWTFLRQTWQTPLMRRWIALLGCPCGSQRGLGSGWLTFFHFLWVTVFVPKQAICMKVVLFQRFII